MVPAIDNPNLTIIIPTLNESGTIRPLIESIIETLEPTPPRVIIIDDGSTDGTIETIQDLQLEHDGITLIERGEKLGFGTALRDGFKAALDQTPEPDFIVTMDADLSHDPSHLPALIQACDRQSLVIGSRYTPGGEIHGWGPYRKTVSWGANFLARTFIDIPAKDCTSGYRCYGNNVVDAIIANIKSKGYDIQVESLAEITRRGFEIKEIPINFQDRVFGESKLKSGQIMEFALMISSLFLSSGEWKRFLKFNLVGFSGIIINEIILWALTEKIGVYYLISGIISTEAGILNNFIWNDIWTFRDRVNSSSRTVVRLFKFNTSRITSVVFSIIILSILTDTIHVNYLLSNFISIIVVSVYNYILGSSIVWNRG